MIEHKKVLLQGSNGLEAMGQVRKEGGKTGTGVLGEVKFPSAPMRKSLKMKRQRQRKG